MINVGKGETDENEKTIYDPLHTWEDHDACWQMQYRGSLGKLLLPNVTLAWSGSKW